MTTAKKGDLLVVEYHTDYGVKGYEIERVTSVSREGEAKKTCAPSLAPSK